jgi:hypothetical protein
MEKITADNWTFAGYRSDSLTAILSLGAVPSQESEVDIIYYMSVIDPDGSDLYQEEFTTLAESITKINTKYGHWDFIDRQGNSASGGGCGDCAAH